MNVSVWFRLIKCEKQILKCFLKYKTETIPVTCTLTFYTKPNSGILLEKTSGKSVEMIDTEWLKLFSKKNEVFTFFDNVVVLQFSPHITGCVRMNRRVVA